jgi:hypothetical protein
MPISNQSAVAESARCLSKEISEAWADGSGLLALTGYLERLHAQLASKSGHKAGSARLIRSKAEVTASAEAVARLATEVSGSDLTRAHQAAETDLCQLLLDLGMPTAPALRIAQAAREYATLVVTSLWLST